MVSLFIEPEKVAAVNAGLGLKNTVEGPPEGWSEQVMSALYTDHPYMLDYEPSFEISRFDPDAGYMLGVITFGPEDNSGKILAVIQDKQVLPFATFVHNGVAYPLTEERVGEVFTGLPEETAISRDNVSIQEMTRDQDMTPPEHAATYGGLGNRIISNKMASSLLSKVSAPTHIVEEYNAALEPEWAHPIKALLEDRVTSATWGDDSVEKVAEDYGAHHDTFMVRPGNSSHLEVVSTSSSFRKVASRPLTRYEAEQTFTPGELEDMRESFRERGYHVMSDAKVKLAEEGGLGAAELVTYPGMWTVKKTTGESLVGTAMPDVVDFDGNLLPLQLFYNGSAAAVQDAIAGEYISEFKLPEDDVVPRGESVFVFRSRQGDLRCTIPFVVLSTLPTEYGPTMVVETYLGDRVKLVRSGVVGLAAIDDETCAVPEHFRLVNIGDPQNRCDLINTPEGYSAFQKMGSHRSLQLYGGGDYWIKGSGYNLRNLDQGEAHMHLAAVGAPSPLRLMKKADQMGITVNLYGHIPEDQTAQVEEKFSTIVKQAHAVTESWRPNPDTLVKIAAWILEHPNTINPGDLEKTAKIAPETVDTVLSLGFVSPNNTRNFVESIGDIEDATRKMASLVIASQLGYSEIPLEEAVSALYSMEKVLAGLRRLQAQVD